MKFLTNLSLKTFIVLVVSLGVYANASAQGQEEFLTACGAGSGGVPSPWNTNGNQTFYTDGNVGIGTNAPQSKLEVKGDIKADNIIVGEKDLKASFGLGTADCYMIRPDRFTSAVCKDNFYVKAIYKSTDGDWDGYGTMCCRADSTVDVPTLPTAQKLDAECPWGWGRVLCSKQTTTSPANAVDIP